MRRNERGPTYWTTCTVIACEPEHEFAFAVGPTVERALNTWRYELRATDDGTAVTESFALKPTLGLRVYWTLLGWARGKRNRSDMERTLLRMKAIVEAG